MLEFNVACSSTTTIFLENQPIANYEGQAAIQNDDITGVTAHSEGQCQGVLK